MWRSRRKGKKVLTLWKWVEAGGKTWLTIEVCLWTCVGNNLLYGDWFWKLSCFPPVEKHSSSKDTEAAEPEIQRNYTAYIQWWEHAKETHLNQPVGMPALWCQSLQNVSLMNCINKTRLCICQIPVKPLFFQESPWNEAKFTGTRKSIDHIYFCVEKSLK